jgi:hypothetical protein
MTVFVEYQPKVEMKKSPGKFFEAAFIVTIRYGGNATVAKVPMTAYLEMTRKVKEHPEYLT